MLTLTASDLSNLEKLARVQLANSLPGAKPICLIGTTNGAGQMNLAPFSSVIHLGSDPCLLGMVSRPDLVERHTLSNILETRQWTINHLHPQILDQAHQCSARYPREASEFAATGLTQYFHPSFNAPFVVESRLRIGMELEDVITIPANGTQLIIGRVVLVQIADGLLSTDGSINLVELDSLVCTALDTYFRIQPLARLEYARPELLPARI